MNTKEWAAILFGMLLLYILYTSMKYRNLNPMRLFQPSLLIDAKAARRRRYGLILDVRSEEEREHLGYYPNSIPVSLETIQKEVPFLQRNRNTSILIYSNGDKRAERAAHALYDIGYEHVQYIREEYRSMMPGYE
jgi:rhodanese-related sulfurtransferase